MSDLPDVLRDYRAGKTDRATLTARFVAAGFDQGDANALADNLNYQPLGDMAQQFIDQQARRRRVERNPLLP